MRNLTKLAVVTGSAAGGGQAFSVLDRMAGGYPCDGGYRGRLAPIVCVAGMVDSNPDWARRVKDLELTPASDVSVAVQDAEAVVVLPDDGRVAPEVKTLEAVFGAARSDCRCFVVGVLAERGEEAERLAALARQRGVRWSAAGLLSATHRLPENGLEGNGRSREALIVVQGSDDAAVVDGVQGLVHEVEVGPQAPVAVRRYRKDAVWKAAALGEWSWELLGAALSRSSNPLGNSVTDGRTQDLVGLGMVQRLAEDPRAWVTDHVGGGRSVILALDGVVKDVNVAARDRSGGVRSARLYRPPAPNEAGYHRLAALIEDFCLGGPASLTEAQGAGMAHWLGALRTEH